MKINTKPFLDQKPGTNGLRKKSKIFMQKNYLENYLQSIFDSIGKKQGETIIIGGDGRFFNEKAINIAIKMAIANGFSKILVAQNGLLSTPAASNLIRIKGAKGGLIFSASHNVGGKNGDFGVKYNIANGGPAPEILTDKIFLRTREIDRYFIADCADFDLQNLRKIQLSEVEIEIIDSIRDYALLMEKLFDFNKIAKFFANGFNMCFDAMNAVNGPYAKYILEEMVGAKKNTVKNAIPLEDFGGLHPDPNLIYAKELYDLMMAENAPDFGAATDGDGDRNLIIGKNCFVTPPDSLAILAANLHLIKGYKAGIRGIARSMPTSMAADRVAEFLGVEIYETPTGWKFFGNLLDGGKISICGEESFGTGSDHVREKDGLWAVLAWLNILAVKRQSVKEIVTEHWQKFGRNYYTRHDYEEIAKDKAEKLIENLEKKLNSLKGQQFAGLEVALADNFAYQDPIDGSISENQGFRILFANGARIIVRKSGTGTIGATIRIYIEHYEPPTGKLFLNTQYVLEKMINIAKEIVEIEKITDRKAPDIIT